MGVQADVGVLVSCQVIGVRSFECRLVFGLSVGGGGSSSSGVRPSGYR